MKTIEIDEEVFKVLLAKVRDFGDTPNLVLRREFGIERTQKAVSTRVVSALGEFLESTEFKFSRGAVGRFLAILSWVYKRNPASFKVVEEIRGRGRIYFSKDVEELKRSGRSVNPKVIEGTPYWVITTTPTDLKQKILEDVLKALGFDSADIRMAANSLER